MDPRQDVKIPSGIFCLQIVSLSNYYRKAELSQSELRLPLLQVVSSNKYFSVGVQSPTDINAPRGCAVILKRRCQLALTRITHQVSRAFDLNDVMIWVKDNDFIARKTYVWYNGIQTRSRKGCTCSMGKIAIQKVQASYEVFSFIRPSHRIKTDQP